MNEPWIAEVREQLLDQQRVAEQRLNGVAGRIADLESQGVADSQLPVLYLQYEHAKFLRDECAAALRVLNVRH